MKSNDQALARVLVHSFKEIINVKLFIATKKDIILYKGTHVTLCVPVMNIGDSVEV